MPRTDGITSLRSEAYDIDCALQMARIMDHWFKKFGETHGFPDNYTTIDLETSGLSAKTRQICTYGYTIVRDRKPVHTEEVALNWPSHSGIDNFQLRVDLQETEQAMVRKGRQFHHTFEYLQTYGIDPIEAIQKLLDLVEQCEQRNEVIVAQNGWAFDTEFMRAAFHYHLGVGWDFHPDLIYDCGIMEKASQLQENRRPLPLEGESLQTWAYRIGEMRVRGVKWALDEHCDQKYDIFRKAGLSVEDAHRSGPDSQAIAALFECQRELAEV